MFSYFFSVGYLLVDCSQIVVFFLYTIINISIISIRVILIDEYVSG